MKGLTLEATELNSKVVEKSEKKKGIILREYMKKKELLER